MILILSVIIVILDQISKSYVIKYLKNSKPIIVIPDFFKLAYVENLGAAFGILQNKRWLFVIITLAVIVYISFFMIKNSHKLNLIIKLGVGMLIGGAIGNFVDRIRYGYVVDFLSFRLLNRYEFPVFNIADCFIVVGTILILTLVLFDKYEV